jgi:nitronate monooxygenase
VDALRMGYAGVQCGTRFIATRECDASEAYKAAILATDASGIVPTERLTGVPLAVIDTPAVQRMGLHANGVERWLLKNPRTKHALRMLLTVRSAWSLRRGARVDRSQLWAGGEERGGDPLHRARRRDRAAMGQRTGGRGLSRIPPQPTGRPQVSAGAPSIED